LLGVAAFTGGALGTAVVSAAVGAPFSFTSAISSLLSYGFFAAVLVRFDLEIPYRSAETCFKGLSK
jgi:hypothetical protein